MVAYIIRRLLIAIVLVWLVSVITFVFYARVPEDTASFLLDMQKAKPAQIEQAHRILGTDKPFTTQYAKYVWRALHGDFGVSWQTVNFFTGNENAIPVGPMVWHALGVTAALAVGGLALMLLIALPLGVIAATKPRSWVDRLSAALAFAAISTHPLVLGLLLQLFVGNKWGWAPPSGYCPLRGHAPDPSQITSAFGSTENVPLCGGPRDWFAHMVLPWITFALFFVALYMRVVRARMIEVLGEPYIRTARAKGASEIQVVRHHALRNAMAAIVTMLGMDAGMAIGIAMYVETVYALPGLGRTTVLALGGQSGIDLPVILAVTMTAALVVIVLNLVVDLALLVIDPRISRAGARGVVRGNAGAAA
jgi:peptide/nickel transport system permease protein